MQRTNNTDTSLLIVLTKTVTINFYLISQIPVCSFFLQGKCFKSNCNYLHVFLGPSAKVCQKFAETGKCELADQVSYNTNL